ncbi:hypothetical protein WN51_05526 [Melipona quadrifasciata]|uniref:Uncharacterized protein n=1 Tax=Melipona quadrifasciata TaxID=166423 RepID=A0A0N0BDJ2_9HYME|nr:hypothetical protein WN51_05526 [Melipona quadrifasciata]
MSSILCFTDTNDVNQCSEWKHRYIKCFILEDYYQCGEVSYVGKQLLRRIYSWDFDLKTSNCLKNLDSYLLILKFRIETPVSVLTRQILLWWGCCLILGIGHIISDLIEILEVRSKTLRKDLEMEAMLEVIKNKSESIIQNKNKLLDNVNPGKLRENIQHHFTTDEINSLLPQIQCSPFRDSIFRLFSSQKDNHLNLKDILDLCSAFSKHFPHNVRAAWVFYIFGKTLFII